MNARVAVVARGNTSRLRLWQAAFGLLFVVAVGARLAGPGQMLVVDERLWLSRSWDFAEAVIHLDFGGTGANADGNGIGAHPGVATMWAAGLAMSAYYAAAQRVGAAIEPFRPEVLLSYLAIAQVSLALLNGAGLVVVFWLLRRLYEWPTALLAFGLIAFNPLLIAHSRIVHVDAPLTTAAIVSVLALLVHVQTGRFAPLIISGVAGGIGALSKAPGLLLVPWAALAMAATIGWPSPTWHSTIETLRGFGLWILAALAVYFIAWPSLWVNPVGTVSYLFERSTIGVLEAHDAGAPTGTLDLMYYPRALLQFGSPVTVVLLLAGLIVGGVTARRGRGALIGRSEWLVLLFIALFLAMITMTAKKGERYALPIVPAIDLLAAVVAIRALDRLSINGWRPGVLTLSLAIAVVLPLRLHPYYLAYYNPLAGKPVKIGWGEGLELAAHYLNRKPNASQLAVATWYPSVFEYFFEGRTLGLSRDTGDSADYVVLYRNMFGRPPDAEASRMLEYFFAGEPEHTVKVNGLEYAWIYRR